MQERRISFLQKEEVIEVASSSASDCVLRITLSGGDEAAFHVHCSHFVLLSSKITGLNPSVQQKTPVPFSFIHGKSPPNLNVVTALYRSSQAQVQNPSGIRPSSSTMNSWPSLNRLHASIACPIGGLSPNICFESVFFTTVIFTALLSTIRSPMLHVLATLLVLTRSCNFSSRFIRHMAPSPTASKPVRRPTPTRGRSGRAQKVSFRLPVEVAVLLREHVPNVSLFLRRLVYSELEKLPVYFEMEEFWLELEVCQLADELEKVHYWQKLVLKHGSYAEAYLQKLKGGFVRDRKPHFLPEPPPFVKPEELVTVSDIVKYREALAKRLVQLLNRLMELKLSKSRDTRLHADATTQKEE